MLVETFRMYHLKSLSSVEYIFGLLRMFLCMLYKSMFSLPPSLVIAQHNHPSCMSDMKYFVWECADQMSLLTFW